MTKRLQPAEKAARICEHVANHDRHGYSQPNREGTGWVETVDLGDGIQVVLHDDYDCSRLVTDAYRVQGIDVGGASYTGNMYLLVSSGNFKSIPIEQMQRGDILNTTVNKHAAMYLGDGKLAEAHHGDYPGGYDGVPGDQDGTEIRIVDYYDDTWTACYRCTVTYKTGWVTDDTGKWMYYESGEPIRNQWKKWREWWYYLGDDGRMVTGWHHAGTKDWYYFGAGGDMYHDRPCPHHDGWAWASHDGRVIQEGTLQITRGIISV